MRLNTTQENSESNQFPWEKCQNNRAILIKISKDTEFSLTQRKNQPCTGRNPPQVSRSWICLLQPFVDDTDDISYIWGPAIVDGFICVRK